MAALTLTAFLASVPPGGTVAVTGMPGTGKSRCLKDADGEAWTRRVVFDPYGSRDLALWRNGHAHAPPWGGTYCRPDELVRHRAELLDFDPAFVVVVPPSLAPEDLGRDFERVARACWNTGGITLIAEEAGLYSRWAVPMIMQIASGGRHAQMRLILVSQSIGRLAIDARRHLSHLVAFAQGEAGDLDDLRKRAGRELADRVARLQPGDPPELWRLGGAVPRRAHG